MSSERSSVQWHGQLAVVTLPEETDASNAAAVQDELMAVLRQRPSALIADMSTTTFCDSAGVRAVMLAYRHAAAAGSELRLVIGSSAVIRVFSLLGVDQLVAIYERLGPALGAVAEHDGSSTAERDGNAAGRYSAAAERDSTSR